MEVKWIKLTTDIIANPKIKKLRRGRLGDKVFSIWVLMLVIAGRCNRGGKLMLTDDLPYDIETLAQEMDFSVKALEFALEQFVRFNMITIEDGVYAIKNWEKYQNVEGMERVRESKRLAQARWRAKQKESTVDSTRYLVDDAEEEREEETEKDKEKEIEFHSVNHAREDDYDDLDDFVENSVENPPDYQMRKFLWGTLGQGVVMLSTEQFDDLLDRLSLEEFQKYIGIVRDQELAGKHYKRKTHYQAILEMAEADRRIGPR